MLDRFVTYWNSMQLQIVTQDYAISPLFGKENVSAQIAIG